LRDGITSHYLEIHHWRPLQRCCYVLTKQFLSNFAHIDTAEEAVTRKEKEENILREGCYRLLNKRGYQTQK
jgi:hypothetical protein